MERRGTARDTRTTQNTYLPDTCAPPLEHPHYRGLQLAVRQAAADRAPSRPRIGSCTCRRLTKSRGVLQLRAWISPLSDHPGTQYRHLTKCGWTTNMADAEQQRCGQGRPVDAARGSSDSPGESLCSRDRPSMPRTAATPFVRGAQAFKCMIATREPLSAAVSGSVTAMHDLKARAID